MLASELIAKLQAIVAEHGDVKVNSPNQGCGCCSSGSEEPEVTYQPERVEKIRRPMTLPDKTWPAYIWIEGRD